MADVFGGLEEVTSSPIAISSTKYDGSGQIVDQTVLANNRIVLDGATSKVVLNEETAYIADLARETAQQMIDAGEVDNSKPYLYHVNEIAKQLVRQHYANKAAKPVDQLEEAFSRDPKQMYQQRAMTNFPHQGAEAAPMSPMPYGYQQPLQPTQPVMQQQQRVMPQVVVQQPEQPSPRMQKAAAMGINPQGQQQKFAMVPPPNTGYRPMVPNPYAELHESVPPVQSPATIVRRSHNPQPQVPPAVQTLTVHITTQEFDLALTAHAHYYLAKNDSQPYMLVLVSDEILCGEFSPDVVAAIDSVSGSFSVNITGPEGSVDWTGVETIITYVHSCQRHLLIPLGV